MESYASEAGFFNRPVPGAVGWHFHAMNDNIGSTVGLMKPTSGTTHAQLAAEDLIEGDSDQAGDTAQSLTVWGINNSGKKERETIALSGTTAVNGTVTWRYIENIRADAESAGIMWVARNTGNTFIMEIEAGWLTSGIAQHFNGEDKSYITYFRAGMFGRSKKSINFELRWYPDDADCLDSGDGYEILDRVMVGGGYDCDERTYNQAPCPSVYPMPIGPLPAGGWISVWAIGVDGDTCKGWCTLQGFDVGV